MRVRKFRILRLKHGISLKTLGAAAGLSQQRVSQIELGKSRATEYLQEKIGNAFLVVIAEKFTGLSELENDYLNNIDSLFEEVEESHEL